MKDVSLTSASRCLTSAAALLLASVAMVLPAAQAQDVTAPITTRPLDASGQAFVDDLLHRMTLEEKLGQMSQAPLNQPNGTPTDTLASEGRVGSFLFITDAAEINRLQHLALEKSRLHIPLLFGFDVIHGFRTIYPVPIALSASWDPAAAERTQRMAALEASATGVQWTFAPMVDIARDPRWGRIMEGAGEDPYLGSKMAAAQVRGFQGETLGAPGHILACVKHFAGYGAAVGGRDYEESNISDEQLWNVYLPPFHAALAAGAGSLMSAYMDLNGVPATGNRFLLHDILRDDWKFKGFVVSDWESVKSLTVHGFSKDAADAAARAVHAGVDMEMTSTTFRDALPAALKAGIVQQSEIDQAVQSILTTKYQMGLFAHPYADPSKTAAALVSADQRTAAREVATRTMVLLRNEGGILPIAASARSIALIGPLADSKSDIMGSWSLAGHPSDSVTVREGIQKRFGSEANVTYTTGVEIERTQRSIFDGQFTSPKPKMTTDAQRAAEFQHAIDLVNKSDVSILVLGEQQSMSGERAARQSLDLPGDQEKLLEAAVATGKPVVLVLLNARPLNILWASEHVPAILEAWYPGTEGGNAIASVLAGDVNPGGKLPVSWPRSIGQLPVFYAHNLSQIPNSPATRYWDGSSAPLYPFGFGLSYTSFKLSNLKVSAAAMPVGGKLSVTIDLENLGSRDGDEVVQLYIHQRSGSASRPVRELKGFKRISVKAGSKQAVTLTLDSTELGFWSPQTHRWSVEPADFDLWVGSNATAEQHSTFTVTP